MFFPGAVEKSLNRVYPCKVEQVMASPQEKIEELRKEEEQLLEGSFSQGDAERQQEINERIEELQNQDTRTVSSDSPDDPDPLYEDQSDSSQESSSSSSETSSSGGEETRTVSSEGPGEMDNLYEGSQDQDSSGQSSTEGSSGPGNEVTRVETDKYGNVVDRTTYDNARNAPDVEADNEQTQDFQTVNPNAAQAVQEQQQNIQQQQYNIREAQRTGNNVQRELRFTENRLQRLEGIDGSEEIRVGDQTTTVSERRNELRQQRRELEGTASDVDQYTETGTENVSDMRQNLESLREQSAEQTQSRDQGLRELYGSAPIEGGQEEDVENAFAEASEYFQSEVSRSSQEVVESSQRARSSAGEISEFNPVSITAQGITGLEAAADEVTDLFDPSQRASLSDDDFDVEGREEELEGTLLSSFGGPATAPVESANLIVSAGGATATGAAAEASTGGRYDSDVAGDELLSGTAGFLSTQVEAAAEDPVAFGSTFVLGAGAGATASRTTRAGVRTASDVDADSLPTTQASADTFDADNLNIADTLDPRTGFGRTPRPGEPTPPAYRTRAAEAAEDVSDFLKGDLGERPATPSEIQEQFDEADIIMGRNRPDTGDPSDPVTVPRSRRDVFDQKTDDVVDRLEQLQEDLPFKSRKGQVYMGTGQRVKVKKRVKESGEVDEDVGTVDYLTPDDRRPLDFADEARSRLGNIRRDLRDINRNQRPDADTGSSLRDGLGVGLGVGLDTSQGQDQDPGVGQDPFQREDSTQEFEQVPETVFEQDNPGSFDQVGFSDSTRTSRSETRLEDPEEIVRQRETDRSSILPDAESEENGNQGLGGFFSSEKERNIRESLGAEILDLEGDTSGFDQDPLSLRPQD